MIDFIAILFLKMDVYRYQASQFMPCGLLCKPLDKYGNEVNDVGSLAIMTLCTSLQHGDASFRELISMPVMLLYAIFPA